MNVSAVKQVLPCVKFLYRASKEKRKAPKMAAACRPGSLSRSSSSQASKKKGRAG